MKQPATLRKLANNHQILDVGDIFPRGKYVGKTVMAVLTQDPNYIVWVSDNNKFAIKHRIVQSAKTAARRFPRGSNFQGDYDYDQEREDQLFYGDEF